MRVGIGMGVALIAGFAGVAALICVFRSDRTAATKLTISRETTYITGPIGPDGSVDYVAAIDQRCREGVNAENNASVLLWQALGPLSLPHDQRDAFFRSLGIPTLPEQGDYFVPVEQFANIANVVEAAGGGQAQAAEVSAEALKDQLDTAVTQPWTSEEFGTLAEWLQANAGPLELVVQASRRPRRYDPLVLAPEELYRLVLAETIMAHKLRDFATSLVARGMHRVAQHQIDEAWQDLMAVHHLARLTAQGPMLVESLAALKIGGEACAASRALLQHVELDPAQIARMRAQLDQLVPLPDVVDKIDAAERIAWLDSLATAHNLMTRGAIDASDESLGAALRKLRADSVDWDRVSREMNASCDRYVSACREEPRTKRQTTIARLDRERKKRTDGATTITARIWVALGSRATVTDYVSAAFCEYSMPPFAAVYDAQDRGALELELTKLAFALAAYQAERGRYPDKLAELVPQYIAKVPVDPFADAPVRYTVDADGYVLRSNGIDGQPAPTDATESDDIIVRLPLMPRLDREP